VETLISLRAGQSGWPAELACARAWYEPHIERLHEDAITRRSDLIQLEQIATGYPSRERFLTELALDCKNRSKPAPDFGRKRQVISAESGT